MKSIMIFNQKGGVGKSTTSGNIMAELTARKFKVLGIDLDGQGHLTKFLGVNTNDENTMYELLSGEATFADTVKSTKYGDLLPCDEVLQRNMLVFASDPTFQGRMQEVLANVKDNYDYAIIDCPPALNQVTLSTLVAANYLIIPTEAERFSIDGVSQIIETINKVRGNNRLNPDLRVMGLLITKYSGRRIMTRSAEKTLDRVAKELLDSKVFQTKISNLSDIPYSQAEGVSVKDYKTKSKSAKEYESLVDEILTEVKKNG